MKKVITVILALLMCISLVSCGKSESVSQAEEAIASIGEVTLDSEETIKSAEKLYNILTDSEKEKVENRMTLIDAREAFDSLKEEALQKEEELKKKEIFDNAKKAFEKIYEVEKYCIGGMDDIYGAWYFGIYDADDYYSSTVMDALAKETPNLTKNDLEKGWKALGYSTKALLTYDWNYCLYTVESAQKEKGIYKNIDNNLTEAKSIMQKLTDEYNDYEYYPKLKDYYSKVASYADFFKNPTGSFNQLADTINDYENNIRTYRSDLEFLFK